MLTFLILHFKPAAPLLVPCWWSFLMVALTKWPVKGLPAAPITLKGFVSPLLLPDNPILTADIRKYHCCFYRLCITFNRGAVKKAFFLGKVSPKVWTHPPTQGFCEIWENERWNSGQKYVFRVGGFWGIWTLFGNQTPHPPTFGKDIPKKTLFSLYLPLKRPMTMRHNWPKNLRDIKGDL